MTPPQKKTVMLILWCGWRSHLLHDIGQFTERFLCKTLEGGNAADRVGVLVLFQKRSSVHFTENSAVLFINRDRISFVVSMSKN